MSLHYLVIFEKLIAHVLPLSCYRKKLQNLHVGYATATVAPDLNPVDNSMWEIKYRACN